MTSYLCENEAENLQNGDFHLAQIPDFEITLAERASNLTFSKCLHLVDLNNPRILMTDDEMAVTANIRT